MLRVLLRYPAIDYGSLKAPCFIHLHEKLVQWENLEKFTLALHARARSAHSIRSRMQSDKSTDGQQCALDFLTLTTRAVITYLFDAFKYATIGLYFYPTCGGCQVPMPRETPRYSDRLT